MKNGRDYNKVPVQFRWPVVQTSDYAIVVDVPVGVQPLFRVDEDAVKALNLNPKETDQMIEAAFEAAIRSIMIVR